MRTTPFKPYLIIAILITASIVLATVVGSFGPGGKRRPEGMRVVRMVKASDNVYGTAGDEELGRGWWEEQRFAEYCRMRGWKDIRLEVRTTVGDYLQKFVASAAGGAAPDFVQLYPADVANWNDQGLLEPLDDYLVHWDAYNRGHINDGVLDLCRTPDGKLISISALRHAPAVYAIRCDWLERLGLQLPTTWAEAYEVWKQFTYGDPDGNGVDDTFGFAISMRTMDLKERPPGRGQHLAGIEPFMLAAGVNWYRMTPEGRILPAFNSPVACDTLDFIKRCYKEGLFGKDVMYRANDLTPFRSYFGERRAGMVFHIYPNFYKSDALQYGIFDKTDLIPFLWKDEQFRQRGIYATSTYLSRSLCLLKTCQDKDAAWKFIEYLMSKFALNQSYSKRSNAREVYLGRFGLYSAAVPWLSLRNDLDVQVQMEPWIEQLARPLEPHVRPLTYVATWSEISQMLSEVFVDYYLDRYPTAQATLDEAEKRFLQITAAYDRKIDIQPHRTSINPKE